MIFRKEVKLWIKSNWLVLVILLGLAAITYLNSFNNAFLSDDIAEIRDNPNIGNFSYIFTHPFGFIRLLLNWIIYQTVGLTPFGFRLINIFLHLGNIFLIYIILKTLLSKRIAFFASLLFAIHPAISEAVVWISGGTYPQYSFFFLLSFLLYILPTKRKLFYLLSSIFYLFSFMSHPVMPVGLFLVFPLYEFIYGKFKKNWLKVIPFIIISITYIFINLGALPERETTLQTVHYQEKGIDNPFLIIPISITSYLELIFWPQNLTLYHSELNLAPLNFWIRVLILLLIIGGWILAFKKNKSVFFWLSFSFIALSPTLTPLRLNWIVAERYLYLPVLGIFTIFAIFFDYLSKKGNLKVFLYSLFAILILLLSARTIFRNIDWASEDNLWLSASKTSPSSPNNHNNLGDMYGRWGDKQRAIQEFQTAILLKPNYADAYHNMANAYRELGQLDQALENYQKATELNPHLWQSYQNIAAIYFQEKQYDKALENMQKAIALNPKNLNLYLNLGVLYLTSGNKEKAKEVFNQILSVNPQNQIARQGLIEASK